MDGGRRRALLAGTALALGGCSLDPNRDHRGAGAPEAAPLATAPRVAWVFGSGGPRGFVHVGVVKALAELGLASDVIVGASVGALVGTLCAAGIAAADVEALALDMQPWQLLRWNPLGRERVSGSGIAAFVDEQLKHRPLQTLPVPMVCAAQRLRDGTVVGFTHGRAGLAVQAATAIPGRFAPVTIRGERYADADLRMPLPVRLALSLGAARVLAVDASAHEERTPPGAEEYRESDLHKRRLTAPDAALADLLLHPDIGYWAGISRDYRERVIAAGYRETLAQAARLRALHAA